MGVLQEQLLKMERSYKMDHKIILQDIPTDINYEGYLWWSDQENPDVYNNQPIVSQTNKPIWPKPNNNPFIIEGNLWDNDKTSYLIRFIDGQCLVYKFELNNDESITPLEYLPNPKLATNNLLFKEVWTAQPDPLCEGFEVLKPAVIAFVGFKKQEDKK